MVRLLQNRTFIYKEGILCYKWDSRVTIYPLTTIVHYICIDLAIF